MPTTANKKAATSKKRRRSSLEPLFMGASSDCYAPASRWCARCPQRRTDRPARTRSLLSRFSAREGRTRRDRDASGYPLFGGVVRDRRWAPFPRRAFNANSCPCKGRACHGVGAAKRSGARLLAGNERRARGRVSYGIAPQGLKTKPGPIITLSGIFGRSSNSSGFFFITFRMCLGSMCLLTSKVALSTPRRSKVSWALQSAR
jgi:hypothetical protein